MKNCTLSGILLLFSLGLQAQTTVNRDPAIAQLVADVSADSLRAHVTNLVSFGTRHTMSSATPKRGLSAARQWTLGKFQHYAKQSGGRLTAQIDRWLTRFDNSAAVSTRSP